MPTDPSAGSSTRRNVLMMSAVTVSMIFLSRVLGLVRVQVLSAYFGAADAGALRAAFDLPDLLFYLVAGGALRSGFVPVFTDLLNQGRTEPAQRARAWWLFSVLVTLVSLASAALILPGIVFADKLIAPMTGQWSSHGGYSPQAIELTVFLTRVLLPAQFFLLVGGVLSGALDSLKRISIPTAAPNVYNLCIIGAMIVVGKRYGVASNAYGAILGAFLGQFLWQGAALWYYGRPEGFRYRPAIALRDPLVQRVMRVAAPIILGLCVAEINLKVSGWVVSPFGEAARAWFDNASRIARLPDGIFGAGLGVAAFPYLTQLAVEGRRDDFRRQAEQTLRLAMVCAMPCAALLAGAAHPIVALLFGHGKFTAEDVRHTAQMLPLFAPGVVPITLQVVITRAFYANEDSLTPVKVGLAAVAVGLLLNLLLGQLLGPLGPPLALSITSLLNVCGLFWLYHRTLGFAEGRKMVSVGWRSLLAALLTAVATGGALALLSRLSGGGNLLRSLFATGFCFALYGLLLRVLRVEEMNDAARLFRRKPPRAEP